MWREIKENNINNADLKSKWTENKQLPNDHNSNEWQLTTLSF